MRRWLTVAALVVLVFVAVLVVNAWRVTALEVAVEPATALEVDLDAATRRLGAAIAIPTVSADDAAPAPEFLVEFHALLEASFPRVHAVLRREVVGAGSLLYTWRGRDPDCAPLLLAAHQDVVPVETGSVADWPQPPFSGVVADGFVWGRGALDDKAALMAILEAAEALLAEGFVPACTTYFAFGHDEEIGGAGGARLIAARLEKRGVRPALVLDEGGAVTRGLISVTQRPVAVVAVGAKGYVTLRLSVRGGGGHSSMPPRRTAIGRLARAVARLEEAPMPARLEGAPDAMVGTLAGHLPFAQRFVLANRGLFRPWIERELAAAPGTDAMLRSTTAPTVFRAGVKDNALPGSAEALVNFRVKSGEVVDAVIAHVRRVIDDPGIAIEPHGVFRSEPSPVAPWDGPEFALISGTLRAISPHSDLIVAPTISNATIDARHYVRLTDRLYGFAPFTLEAADLPRIHGVGERIAVADFDRMIRFYAELLRRFDRTHAGGKRQTGRAGRPHRSPFSSDASTSDGYPPERTRSHDCQEGEGQACK